MPEIIVEGLIPEGLPEFTTYQIYNCLDSAVTAQLAPAIRAHMGNTHLTTYQREFDLQSLCMEMSMNGFPVNQLDLADMLWRLEKKYTRGEKILQKFCLAVGWPSLNPNSPKQVADFFYSHLGLPAIYEFDRATRQRKISTDAKALEKLREQYPIAMPFVNAILSIRENRKMASVFKRGLERNGTLRCDFSPAGTDTGRLSSQQNIYQRGTNAQNLTNEVRSVVTAPEGYVLVNADLKTAESIAVGFIADCRKYIDACLSGDLHTAVTKIIWPGLSWIGDLKSDKKIAEGPFYRHFSYRDMAKRGGHGTNYYGTPRTMAMHLKVATKLIEEFQFKYFQEFPEIPEWHNRVIAEIQSSGTLTNQLGRERRFWGRSSDPTTHRAAIAFDPQSLVADVMNEGLKNAQRWIIARKLKMRILAQIHDAGLFLMPIQELPLLAELEQQLLFPVDFGSKGVMTIPFDWQVGKKWYKDKKNPLALQDYKFGDPLLPVWK